MNAGCSSSTRRTSHFSEEKIGTAIARILNNGNVKGLPAPGTMPNRANANSTRVHSGYPVPRSSQHADHSTSARSNDRALESRSITEGMGQRLSSATLKSARRYLASGSVTADASAASVCERRSVVDQYGRPRHDDTRAKRSRGPSVGLLKGNLPARAARKTTRREGESIQAGGPQPSASSPAYRAPMFVRPPRTRRPDHRG
jgi:hypothetical protein